MNQPTGSEGPLFSNQIAPTIELFEEYSQSQTQQAVLTDNENDYCFYQNAASCPDCGAGMVRQGFCLSCPVCGLSSCSS